MTMKIDTVPILLPDGPLPKGMDHPVAENLLPGVVPPDTLKHIREVPVASGSRLQNPTTIEAEERDAIVREPELAVRQTIPQAQMVVGLIRMARWQW
jgi:hypothetical protein